MIAGRQARAFTTALRRWGIQKARVLPLGGKDRQESVHKGLSQVSPSCEFVLIHDGARPFLSTELLNRCLQEGVACGAVAAALPVSNTIKRANVAGLVTQTLDRSVLWQIQTPQVFRRETIVRAHRQAQQDPSQGRATDDASLVERLGVPVRLVLGDPCNIKVTVPQDLLFAEAIAAHWSDGLGFDFAHRPDLVEGRAGAAAPLSRAPRRSSRSSDMSGASLDLRTGFGYDVHPLAKGRALILGGVRIKHPLGLVGHSDGDVVTHAICDALLGAARLGDIGEHFPDAEEEYRGISSLLLLREVSEMLAANGYAVNNVDATVVAETPKVAPYRGQMERKLAQAAGVAETCVSVKATTTEGLGFAGREEGIACYAGALICKRSA